MTIRIAHLYYDIMNLYGEIGNIKVLRYHLEEQGIKVIIDNLSINDEMDFNKYDLLYMGCGTKDSMLNALNDLRRYKDDLKKYIEDYKYVLFTGNSIDILSKTIFTDIEIEGLNIFNYNTRFISHRIVSDVVLDDIVGFQNRETIIENNKYPIFTSLDLGTHYKNFYGTYIIGPILARNPMFLEHFIKELVTSKNKKFKFKKFDLQLDKKARKSYMETYH